jgi:hypothetical protein
MHYLDHPVCSKVAFVKTGNLKASLFSKDVKTKNMVTTVVQTVVYILWPPGLLLGRPWSLHFLETPVSMSPI